MSSLAAWVVVVVVFLGPMALYVWARRRLWRKYEETVRPPDDLRRADDDYRFPDDDPTGGWL